MAESKTAFWLYVGGRSTPFACRDADRLVAYLNECYRYNGAADIIEGNATYRIPNRVASFIAGNIIRGETVQVQVMGEVWAVGTSADLVQLLRVARTEMLYLDGVVVKSTGTAPFTALRKEHCK